MRPTVLPFRPVLLAVGQQLGGEGSGEGGEGSQGVLGVQGAGQERRGRGVWAPHPTDIEAV